MTSQKDKEKKRPERSIIFHAGVDWRGDRLGELFAGEDRQSRGLCAPPPVFDGIKGAQNPEELLLCSLAQCTMASFLYFVNANNIDLISYKNDVQGVLTKGQDGFAFTEFVLDIKVTVVKGNREKAEKAIKLAERFCLVSNSLTGKKTHKFEIHEVDASEE